MRAKNSRLRKIPTENSERHARFGRKHAQPTLRHFDYNYQTIERGKEGESSKTLWLQLSNLRKNERETEARSEISGDTAEGKISPGNREQKRQKKRSGKRKKERKKEREREINDCESK